MGNSMQAGVASANTEMAKGQPARAGSGDSAPQPLLLQPLPSRQSGRTWLMPLASRASCANEAARLGK